MHDEKQIYYKIIKILVQNSFFNKAMLPQDESNQV